MSVGCQSVCRVAEWLPLCRQEPSGGSEELQFKPSVSLKQVKNSCRLFPPLNVEQGNNRGGDCTHQTEASGQVIWRTRQRQREREREGDMLFPSGEWWHNSMLCLFICVSPQRRSLRRQGGFSHITCLLFIPGDTADVTALVCLLCEVKPTCYSIRT